MTHGSLFSGIDGFSLAATWMGWKNLFTCEIDEFCNIILEYYHKDAIRYNDIKTTDFTVWRGRVDVLTGGFPCQPYSVAGKRKGKKDERHLWPEMLRAIREISPDWIVGENVRGIINWNGGVVFDEVQSNMEALGYEVLPLLLPAAGVNAPHERYRTFFVAHSTNARVENLQQRKNGVYGFEITPNSTGSGCEKRKPDRRREDETEIRTGVEFRGKRFSLYGDSSDPEGEQGQRFRLEQPEYGKQKKGEPGGMGSWLDGGECDDWKNFPTQPPVCVGNDGFSTGVLRRRIREDSLGLLSEKEIDKIISKAISKVREESIKASGNAVVSPLILQIFKTIQKYENLNKQYENNRKRY